MTTHNAEQDVLADIAALIDDQLSSGEPRGGYDHGDPAYPGCPNPYCSEKWHGLKITGRMQEMRWRGVVDPDYDHSQDDSPVMCPGSLHLGEFARPEPIVNGSTLAANALSGWFNNCLFETYLLPAELRFISQRRPPGEVEFYSGGQLVRISPILTESENQQ